MTSGVSVSVRAEGRPGCLHPARVEARPGLLHPVRARAQRVLPLRPPDSRRCLVVSTMPVEPPVLVAPPAPVEPPVLDPPAFGGVGEPGLAAAPAPKGNRYSPAAATVG